MTEPAPRPAPHRLETIAVVFYLAVSFAHFLSLPLLVTWDGHQYLDLAEVLGSPRYPEEWSTLRTPLFPLALRLSLAAFGHGPLAAQAVPFLMGVLGGLVVASAVRALAGPRAAAATLVVLGTFPTLAVFEHAVLGETGTLLFLALLVRVGLASPPRWSGTWLQAGALGLLLAIGYLWRQSILFVAPWVALLHLLSLRRFRRPAAAWSLQALLLAAPPLLATWAWARQFDATELDLRDAGVMRAFALRQRVYPPDDPLVAPVREEYRRAIAETVRGGALSGIPWGSLTTMVDALPPLPAGSTGASTLLQAVRAHPARYLAAAGRTLLFLAGLDGVENEVAIFGGMVLSSHAGGSIVGEGPPGAARRAETLRYDTGAGWVRTILRALRLPYHGLVIVAGLLTLAGLAAAAISRDRPLAAITGLPLAFAAVHALLLLSINRFMVPVYPIALAAAIVVLARWWRRLGQRRAAAGGGQGRA